MHRRISRVATVAGRIARWVSELGWGGRPPADPRAMIWRIVLHDYSGHPFQLELSHALASQGHEVFHLFCSSYISGRGDMEGTLRTTSGLRIEPIRLRNAFARYSPAKRITQEIVYGLKCSFRVGQIRPDIIVCSNAPMFSLALIKAWTSWKRIPFIYWQQDVYSTAMRLGIKRRSAQVERVVGPLLEQIERAVARKSDAIIQISGDFQTVTDRWGIEPSRVQVVENWAPLEQVIPEPRPTRWEVAHGFAGKKILIYSGTLGLKHDPKLLADLAGRLTGNSVLIVISEGLGREWLEASQRAECDPRLVLMDYQPWPDMSSVLSSADILLVLLDADAGVYSVPSKLLTYHCAGRSIVASIPEENLAAEVLRRSGGGVSVFPGDLEAMSEAVLRLLDDPLLSARMGEKARAYAERTFDIKSILIRFDEIISRALAR